MTDYKNIRVCVVTNKLLDGDYIEEWCEHYYNLGFTFIYIMEDINGSDDYLISIPYLKDKVDKGLMLIEQIEHQNQWYTYPQFYDKHGNEFEWCGIFDSDEFLKLNKHKTIQEYLNDVDLDFSNTDSIQFCWRYYDDNDQLFKSNGKVRDRFNRLAEYNRDIIETKIIIKGGLNNVKFFIGHAAVANYIQLDVNTIDRSKPIKANVALNSQIIGNGDIDKIKFCDGTLPMIFSPFHKVNYEVASLDHIYCKSTEEFIKRKSLGRLDIPTVSKHDALIHFMNEYYKLCKRTPEKDAMFLDKLKILE